MASSVAGPVAEPPSTLSYQFPQKTEAKLQAVLGDGESVAVMISTLQSLVGAHIKKRSARVPVSSRREIQRTITALGAVVRRIDEVSPPTKRGLQGQNLGD